MKPFGRIFCLVLGIVNPLCSLRACYVVKQHPVMKRWTAAHLAVCTAVFFSTACAFLRADELPGPLTLDIPVPVNMATPAWLGHPEMPNDTLQTLRLPIAPPSPDAALLITVYFTESNNGFLRINWKPAVGQAVSLAGNFYEGVDMATSRSLLVPPSTMGPGGYLIFQGNAVTLGVQRIELEWLQSRQDLVSPKTSAMLLTKADGTTVPAETANGQPPVAATGSWSGDIVTVPIQVDPARIETGVEFTVALDKVPTTARLVLKETGLSLTQHLVVWINRKRAGMITPVVPGLGDAGFFSDATAMTNFVGWRDGSFYVPATLLKQGENTLQFSGEDEVPPAKPAPADEFGPPLAVKDVALQMNYAALPDPLPGQLPIFHLSAEPILSPVGMTNTSD